MKEVLSQAESLVAGDLISVEWCDASIDKKIRSSRPANSADDYFKLSNDLTDIDMPVKSWSLFIGVLRKRCWQPSTYKYHRITFFSAKLSSGGPLRFDAQTPSEASKPYTLTRTPLSA